MSTHLELEPERLTAIRWGEVDGVRFARVRVPHRVYENVGIGVRIRSEWVYGMARNPHAG